MIAEDNLLHLEKFKTSLPDPSYLAGFIDGDGCIFVRKILGGYQTGFSITQCRTNILQVIRYHFGGSITTTSNRNKRLESEMEVYDKLARRNEYTLQIRGYDYVSLLEHVKDHIVIKREQIQCLFEFSKVFKQHNKHDIKEQLYQRCSAFNSKTQRNIIAFDKINLAYIAGLFDAEGCIYLNLKKVSKSYISITQKSYPEVLEQVCSMLGFGKIDCEKKFKIYKRSDCLKFLELVEEYLIVKFNQAKAMQSFLTTTDQTTREEMYAVCNREKHAVESFTQLNQNDCGKEAFVKRKRLRKANKEEICVQDCTASSI